MAPSITSSRFMYSIRVEGYGDPTASTASNKLYRFAWNRNFFDAPSTSDPDSLYVADTMIGYHREVGIEVDFVSDRVGGNSMSFELVGHDDAANTVWESFWTAKESVTTRLAAALAQGATTATLGDVGLAPLALHLERECIYLASEGGGNYTIQRGQLETDDVAHGVSSDDDVEMFTTPSAYTLPGRLVQLIRTPLDATGYGDESVRWTGVVRSVTSPDGQRIVIDCDDLLTSLRGRKLMDRAWRGAIAGFQLDQWESTTGDVTALDSGYGTTDANRQALFIVEQPSGYAFKASYTDDDEWLIGEDVVKLETAAPACGSPDLGVDDATQAIFVREIHSTHSDAPANNATPSTNTLPLSQTPSVLILQLLLTTVGGDNDATYDLAIENLAGAVRKPLVDIDGILTWGRQGGDLHPVDNLHIGVEGPEELLDVIDKILRPRAAVLGPTVEGKIGVISFADVAPFGGANAIIEADFLDEAIPQDRRLEEAIERITLEFGGWPGGNRSTISAKDVVNYRRLPRGGDTTAISIDGSAYSDQDVALAQVSLILQRFHAAIPALEGRTSRLIDQWLGDTVAVTHSRSFAGDGTRGVTARVHLVTGRTERVSESDQTLTYILRDVGLIYAGQGRIAPSGIVQSYDHGNATIVLEPNEFTSNNANDPVDDDVDGFASGYFVMVADQYGTPKQTGLKVDSLVVASHKVVLTASPGAGTIVAGDVLRFEDYSTAASGAQRDDWAYIADASNQLGGSSDNRKEYTS